jgi:hypothetical protein
MSIRWGFKAVVCSALMLQDQFSDSSVEREQALSIVRWPVWLCFLFCK